MPNKARMCIVAAVVSAALPFGPVALAEPSTPQDPVVVFQQYDTQQQPSPGRGDLWGVAGLAGLAGLLGMFGLSRLRSRRASAPPMAPYPLTFPPAMPNADAAETPRANRVITAEEAGIVVPRQTSHPDSGGVPPADQPIPSNHGVVPISRLAPTPGTPLHPQNRNRG